MPWTQPTKNWKKNRPNPTQPNQTHGLTQSMSKFPLIVRRSAPPFTMHIIGPTRPTTPNGIQIQSAVFPQFTGQTDRLTDWHENCTQKIVRSNSPLMLYQTERHALIMFEISVVKYFTAVVCACVEQGRHLLATVRTLIKCSASPARKKRRHFSSSLKMALQLKNLCSV